jgi:hypothetical protein
LYNSLIAIALLKNLVIIAIVAVAIALSLLGKHVGVRAPRESGRHAHGYVTGSNSKQRTILLVQLALEDFLIPTVDSIHKLGS